MKEYIFRDKIGYVTDEISTVPTDLANYSEEHRIKFVTDLAAVSRGKDESNNPEGRYKQLLKEAAGNATPDNEEPMEGHASRVFEFLPVVLDYEIQEVTESVTSPDGRSAIPVPKNYFVIYNENNQELVKLEITVDALCNLNNLFRFSYLTNNKIYTNMRAILNSKLIPYEDVPYNIPDDIKSFSVVKVKCPMFVWSQIMTHTQLTKVSQSDRVSEAKDYWLPDDIFDRFRQLDNESPLAKAIAKTNLLATISIFNLKSEIESNKLKTIEELKERFLTTFSQVTLEDGFRLLGYKREIYQRAMYYFKYKTFVISGWNIDPHQWGHFFFERNVNTKVWKNWTQPETALTVKTIAKVVTSQTTWQLHNWADTYTKGRISQNIIHPTLDSGVLIGKSGINLYNFIHNGDTIKVHVRLYVIANHNTFKVGIGNEDGTDIKEVILSKEDYTKVKERYYKPLPDENIVKTVLYVNQEVNDTGEVTGYLVYDLTLPETDTNRVVYHNSREFYKIYGGPEWAMKESDKKGYEQILYKYGIKEN